MHFWIDKRSQGCGFNRRHPVCFPTSLSGRSKLMVTPVHRFQSIESVAGNHPRHPRAPGYHSRFPHPPIHCNVGNRSTHQNVPLSDCATNVASHTLTSRNQNSPTSKLKCGLWTFFAIVTFFLAGAKYYYHGISMGIEALAFCALLVVILILGGLVTIYESFATAPPHNVQSPRAVAQQEPSEDLHIRMVRPSSPTTSSELPPPPYHIAVMLPISQRENQVVVDSPPPPYDKAVI